LSVRAKQAAELCGFGKTKWFELQKEGKIPPSFKVGGARLWRVEDLRLWVQWGFPELDDFVELKKNKKFS
jgi:predicted DNA-binding transcriptional regulator AlpA